MNLVRWSLRVVVAAVLTVALVGLSRLPWAPGVEGDAVLRLAWRFRSTLVDECRRVSPAELAKLPVHMRREVSCERRLTPYAVLVTIDGAVTLDDTVHARGARADRPLSLFQELPLAPGRHALRVSFAPVMAPAEGDAGGNDGEQERETVVPPTLVLDTTVTVEPRRVVLVTIDEARGVLTLR